MSDKTKAPGQYGELALEIVVGQLTVASKGKDAPEKIRDVLRQYANDCYSEALREVEKIVDGIGFRECQKAVTADMQKNESVRNMSMAAGVVSAEIITRIRGLPEYDTIEEPNLEDINVS